MTTTEDKTLDKLNLELSSDQFDAKHFMQLIEKLLTEHASELKIIDLKNNTEAALTETQRQKSDNIRNQNYEFASMLRDKERSILEQILLRRNLEINHSQFILRNATLLFFYLGTEKHDDIAFHLISSRID